MSKITVIKFLDMTLYLFIDLFIISSCLLKFRPGGKLSEVLLLLKVQHVYLSARF